MHNPRRSPEMECRKLELTLVSANSLPDVRILGQMKVYAKVSIAGESRSSKKTPADREGDTNPRWNFTVDYMINEPSIYRSDVVVAIKIFCKRTLGDRFVGEVNIPVKSLFDKGLKAEKIMSYQVCGTRTGRLNILYGFGDQTVLVRKPSGLRWKNAIEVGFLVLLGGAILLLGDKHDDNDDDRSDVSAVTRDVHVVEYYEDCDADEDEDEDGDVFYDF